jgi:hypothetical protein
MWRARIGLASAIGIGACMVALTTLVACGSRTGLLVDLIEEVEPDGAIIVVTPLKDAGKDATVPSGPLPMIDSGPPPVVVVKSDCEDAAATLLYVVTEETEVVAFDPPSATFRSLGTLNCPAPDNFQPFSMAVDRTGHAFILYNDVTGQAGSMVFRASLATLDCTATPYMGQNDAFNTFGMGFSTNLGGPSEQLYIAGDLMPSSLGTLDVDSLAVSDIGEMDQQVYKGELTGTGDGRLFTFYAPFNAFNENPSARIGELDKTTGHLLSFDPLPGVHLNNGWAFGFFGGEFYLFTGNGDESSSVTKYDPTTHQTNVIAQYPGLIVGAGVSTCAPEQ